MTMIQNLRIGTKLGFASAIGILLLGLMIYLQINGSAEVALTNANAARSVAVALDGAEAKAFTRGMQLGLREMILSQSPADIQKASDTYAENEKSARRFIADVASRTQSNENRDRAAQLEAAITRFTRGKERIEAVRKEAVSLIAKRNAGELTTEGATRITQLADEIPRIRREVTLPVSAEIDTLSDQITETAKTRGEAAKAAADAKIASVDQISLILSIVTALMLVGTWLFSVFAIARPMRELSVAMNDLAEGNFAVVLPGLGRGDEIGDVAGAVEKFKVKARERAHAEAVAQQNQERDAAEQRKREMVKMADDFENAVGEIVDTVSSASTELEASASTLTATAARAEELTTMVAAASETASTNVQSVASATEEMASSVNEISRQVQESSTIANHAVLQARKTNDRVAELAKAASRIGDVVELINTIAGQTNLLALNATIEAARAGEAGRGFAVVASEVKALAEQTAKATGEISAQISGIQTATQESVGAIKEIRDTIGRMSEIASTIASAVEEQGAATQEISRNVQQAAQGTLQVSSNITDVQRGASETGSASSQVLSAAQSLSSDSNRLKVELGRFLGQVRAA
ncbi:methyl-accepting chemotaxis protein [Tardiphaga sp.]|uniref:methyl-accepting chemotaxis protein n=1 Tax=Tardiphaga sp. TaxID=1926292 RepID=UPI0025D317A1|nr:methyl-accepting chemotaxis protein [Tardiphaga sp.]